MLISLEIRNFLLIKQNSVNFTKGFNAFTGETGAGKSIIMDGLKLALGGKNYSNLNLNENKTTNIKAVFEIDKNIKEKIIELNLSIDDDYLIVERQINHKQKKREINIRTVVNLPGGTGKKVKVAVVCEDNKAQEAKDAGADIVGSDEFVEKIKGGELNFEKLICTPGMMIKLSKLGKVLGPKGLMPNPKLGSVSENIKEAVTNAKSGQVEIRNDKDGNIGVSIGKKSFHDDQLLKNFHAILDALEKEKSNNTLKGDLIKNTFVTSSMGVSYKVKLGKSI